MSRKAATLIWAPILLSLSMCRTTPAPVHPPQFKPPAPTAANDPAPICGHPKEIDAFKIVGLQTQLMQIALSCGGDEKFDAFVREHQPQLAEQRAVLSSFFTRAYGPRRSKAAFDQYITQLADAESSYDLTSGNDFCSLSTGTLDQAKVIASSDDLVSFANKVPVQQAMDVQTCGTVGAPPETPARKVFRHRQRKYEINRTK